MRLRAWILIAACMVVPACGTGGDDTIIRIGYLHNDLHHLPLFVAIEKKMFAEAGLDVRLAGAFRAGPEQMSAFGAGALDVGYVGQAPATAAVLNGVADIRFIAQVNLNGSAIVVRKGSRYTSLQDITGALIAIPGHATMQEFLLHTALAKAGQQLAAIRIIVLKPPEMLQALSRGSIDGFIAWEPYPAQATTDGSGRVLAASRDILDGHPCCVLIATVDFIRRRPAAVRALRAVHAKSCDYINENFDHAVDIGMRYTGFSRHAVAQALGGITYTHQCDIESFERFVEYLVNRQYIKTRSDMPAARELFVVPQGPSDNATGKPD
jgi:NitT/TauT family transport system substrate-binding protein